MAKTAKELKEMTLKEFNKAAGEFCVRGGRLIIRDMTANSIILFLINHL